MTIGSKVMSARLAKGWTRERLAVYAGISASTVGRLERDEMQPRAGTVIALAVALGIPPEELAAEAGIQIRVPPDKWS